MNVDKQHTPMSLSEIAPELQDIIRKIPRVPVTHALGRLLVRSAATLFVRDKPYEGVEFEKQTLPNGITVRVYRPEREFTGAALLWIHGGGLVIGSATQDGQFCAETAHELGIVVVSTEYRLAPESPFPAALDDCYAAWLWLCDVAARLNVDVTRMAIGGESAGGGLAASLVQRIHDTGGVQPAAQWLFCPMLDDRTAARRDLDVIDHKIWNNRQNWSGWHAYLGTDPGTDHVPDYAVAARRGDLSGLPAAWIGTGDIELFFEEDRTYAERLNQAGVAYILDVVPGAPHGFQNPSIGSHTRLAQAYLSRSRAWLRNQLALTNT